MNADMVAAHTPALGSKLFTLGSTYDDGLGIRLGASVGAELKHMDQPFITAPFYPPSVLVTGLIVNKRGRAVRGRGLLPLAHVRLRDGAARLRGVPHRRQRAHRAPDDAAGAVRRRLGDGRGDGGRARPARRVAGRDARAATTSTPPAARTPTSTSPPTGWRRRTTGPWGAFDLTLGHRAVRRLHPRRHPHHRRRRRRSAPTAPWSPASTPPARAPPTSPRTARATPPAPSSARGRSSGGGRAACCARFHWLTSELRTWRRRVPRANCTIPEPSSRRRAMSDRFTVAARANVPPFHVMDLLAAAQRAAADPRRPGQHGGRPAEHRGARRR